MHPLVSIALVLFTALLWSAFTVLMLLKLERTGHRARSGKLKVHRLQTGGFRGGAVAQPWLLRRVP